MDFGILAEKAGMSETAKNSISKAIKEFGTLDTRVLYVLVIILIVNTFVLLNLLKDSDRTTIYIECGFLILLAVCITFVRIWSFKFYQMNPVMTLWNVAQAPGDQFYFGLTVFFAAVSIILMMVTTSILTIGQIDLGIGMTCATCVVFLITSLFYRLHVGTYINYANTHDLPLPVATVVNNNA